MSNGLVRIHPLSTPYSLSTLDSYWALSMHDNHYGAVSHLATTFDDQYLVSGGEDGNVFVYRTNLPSVQEQEGEGAKELKVCVHTCRCAVCICCVCKYVVHTLYASLYLYKYLSLAGGKERQGGHLYGL